MRIKLSKALRKINVVVFTITAVFLTNLIHAQDGEQLFLQCKACHTIGQGNLLGPDLLDISNKRDKAWIKSFIKSSQTMIKNGNPQAVMAFEEFKNLIMIDYNLPDTDIEAIIKYIDSFSTISEIELSAEDSLAAIKALEMLANIDTDENETRGKALFEGSRKFKNGGASCISCHHVDGEQNVQGGLLAKNLTQTFSRIGGLAGIKGILDFPPYPSMKNAYDKAVLTEEENIQLQVYLMRADNNGNYTDSTVTGFMKQGFVGVIALLIAISLVWYKRKKRSVNYYIIKRQS